MNDTHNNNRTWSRRIAGGLFLVVVAGVLIACGGGDSTQSPSGERAQPLAVPGGPSVAWAPGAITMNANPGTRQAIPITLTAGAAMSNVTVSVPTALRSVVTVAPTTLGSLKAGQQATVTVTVAPSSSEVLRTLGGSISVRAGFATATGVLPISVGVVAPETINGILVPPEPPLELNNLTLRGFDINANRVRDDVERYIAREYPSSAKERAALIQLARSVDTIFIGLAPADLMLQIVEDAVDCTSATFMPSGSDVVGGVCSTKASEALEATLLNTKSRIRSYFEANDRFSGVVSTVLPSERMAERCDVPPSTFAN